MKRSEMVEGMVGQWLGLFPKEHGEDFYEEVRENMSKLLAFLEYRGMTPPFYSELFYKTWRNGGTGHGWEPEND